MKRFLVLSLFLALFGSCSLDDNDNDFVLEILPVESVDMPDEFVLGEVYPITVRYARPTDCHSFRNFYYKKELNERTVAIISYKFLNNNCSDLTDDIIEVSFDFIVTSNGSYIFKFWQGEDTNGEDQYLTVEVPVVE